MHGGPVTKITMGGKVQRREHRRRCRDNGVWCRRDARPIRATALEAMYGLTVTLFS